MRRLLVNGSVEGEDGMGKGFPLVAFRPGLTAWEIVKPETEKLEFCVGVLYEVFETKGVVYTWCMVFEDVEMSK